VWTYDAALEPYYLLLKPWAVLTSTSPAFLRFPSVLAMAAAVTILVLFIRAAVDLRMALFTGGSMLVMPSVSRFGQDARPYAFAMLFCVLAVSMWWHYVRDGRMRYGLAYALSLGFAVLMHAYSLTLVMALLVTTVLTAKRAGWTPVVRTLAPAAVSLVLLSPFLLFVARYAKGQTSAPEVSPFSVAYAAAALPSAVLSPPLATVFAGLVIAASLLGIAVGVRDSAPVVRSFAILGASWWLLPPVVLVAVQVLTEKPGLMARYWEFCIPGMAILIAILLRRLEGISMPLVLGVAGLVMVTGLPTQIDVRHIDGHIGQRWEMLPSVLRQPGLAGLPVVISQYGLRSLNAADPDLAEQVVPARDDAAEVGMLSPRLHGVATPDFQQFVAGKAGYVVYQNRLPTGGLPTRKDFNNLVPPSPSWGELAVTCNYFGDALGVFSTAGSSGTRESATRIAGQIEAAASGNATCAIR